MVTLLGRFRMTVTLCLFWIFSLAQAQLKTNVTVTSSRVSAATGGKLRICLSDWTPMVACDGLNASEFTGYQVS
jgi:hypothetical protein